MMYPKMVLAGGKIRFRGLIYKNSLIDWGATKKVLVRRDRSLDDADIQVFNLMDEFLCNAHNMRKWARMGQP